MKQHVLLGVGENKNKNKNKKIKSSVLQQAHKDRVEKDKKKHSLQLCHQHPLSLCVGLQTNKLIFPAVKKIGKFNSIKSETNSK